MNAQHLLTAAEAGDAGAVARLLAADRRLAQARDRWRNTPLHHAGNAEVARLLIEHGAGVNADGWMGATPLHHAAQRGRADVAELLIHARADVDARRDERRDTPLHWAANEAVAHLLVTRAADVEARDWCGRTPLHWAAQFGHADVIRYLIRCGAAVNARAERAERAARAPPRTTAEPRTPFARRLLLALDRAVEVMRESARGSAIAAMPDPGRYTGETPLHWAAQEGHAQAAAALLDGGAEVNALTHNGWTPLHKAAFRGHLPLVEQLARAGADLHARTDDGQTPLHVAQRQEMRALLLRLTGTRGTADVPLADPPAGRGLAIRRICRHPTAREALTVADHAVLSRWSLEQPQNPRLVAALQSHHPWFSDIALIPGGGQELLVATPTAVEVRRWDDLSVVRTYEPADGPWDHPTTLAASRDGRWVAVRDRPERLQLMERSSGRVAARVDAGERTLSIAFSPDSRLLATACSFQGGGYVRLDAVGADGQLTPRAEIKTGNAAVDTLARVAFSPDGRRLALWATSAVAAATLPRGWRGDLVLYDVGSARTVWSASIDASVTGDDRPLPVAGYPMGFVTDVTFIGSGDVLACGATAGSVLFYAADRGPRLLHRSVVHRSVPAAAVTALAYEATTNLVVAGLDNGELVTVPSPNERGSS